MADESESIGQTTVLERLVFAVIIVHLMAKGTCPSPESMTEAYNAIYNLTDLLPFIEFPLFKRSNNLFLDIF